MSRLDVLADLRETRPAAPAELRERVRAIATVAPAPRRPRLTWKRGAAVLVPAVLALAAAAVVLGRGGGSAPQVEHGAVRATVPPTGSGSVTGGADRSFAPAQKALARPAAVPPARGRLQDYDATLALRVHGTSALSAATKQALAIARSLGGFAASVNVDAGGRQGDATLRLRVPVTHVQDALHRLGALGTITGEQTNVQDVQAGVNAIDREIARLQRQLRGLRAGPQTAATARKIAAVTAHVQRLQRSRANTVRTARLATISLTLTTRAPAPSPKPVHHGPLHGAVVALTWLGIGALYALVVGGPIAVAVAVLWLAVRLLRRRAEQRLLERP